ncbi:MAG: DUF4139 domain-containing protein [Marinifilaceae bacterium]|jgi:hypothetical protein|nr:DUF4139 domain-containing protein [Marinifilaceae bacterium]
MKHTLLIIISLFCSNLFSQKIIEKEVKTKVDEVRVFLKGAQISRNTKVELNKGKTTIKFTNLSPYIDEKSIQVKTEGNLIVLSVSHRNNFLNKTKKSAELKALESELDSIDSKIEMEKAHLDIISEELIFLKENRNIGGKNQQLSVLNLKQASEFYSKRLTSLKMKEIERNKKLNKLKSKRYDLLKQRNLLTNKKDNPTGEILVKIDAKTANKASIKLNYLVSNASWFPSYDIRAKNINSPIELIYKANVRQDTKVDWNNVKLKFSTANPNVSGLAPELSTYYLNYSSRPPRYNKKISMVSGIVSDHSGLPLPGVSVVVEGSTIGTTTDMEGKYSLSIPSANSRLSYSFIGYKTKTLMIRNSIMNVRLEEEQVDLQEVVVTGYGRKKSFSKSLNSRLAGVQASKPVKIRGAASLPMPIKPKYSQTSIDFEVNTPYTLKTGNKKLSVDMQVFRLPATYQYYCVPKIDKDAFLIASIKDWEKYSLLAAEANVFFEDTYIGKTLVDLKSASKTLDISLGRDKNVSVSREKIKDFTSKQFIRGKKEESIAWKIRVKNNKSEKINMLIKDQVPVSTLEEILVEIQELSDAKYISDKGEIKWEFNLEPQADKSFIFKYIVKYPKNRNLVID